MVGGRNPSIYRYEHNRSLEHKLPSLKTKGVRLACAAVFTGRCSSKCGFETATKLVALTFPFFCLSLRQILPRDVQLVRTPSPLRLLPNLRAKPHGWMPRRIICSFAYQRSFARCLTAPFSWGWTRAIRPLDVG